MLFYQCPFLNETTDLGPGGDCNSNDVSDLIKSCRGGKPVIGGWAVGAGVRESCINISTLLKMGHYYSTTKCHYWHMSLK